MLGLGYPAMEPKPRLVRDREAITHLERYEPASIARTSRSENGSSACVSDRVGRRTPARLLARGFAHVHPVWIEKDLARLARQPGEPVRAAAREQEARLPLQAEILGLHTRVVPLHP